MTLSAPVLLSPEHALDDFSGILGIRGLLVHAISDEAKTFYEHHGFTASPTQPMTLILSLKGGAL